MITQLVSAALAAALLVGTTVARAEEKAPSPEDVATTPDFRLYLEPAFSAPTGSMANVTGVGLGGLLGASYRVSDDWHVAVRAGYIASSDASRTFDSLVGSLTVTSSVSYAPLLAGAKVYVFDVEPTVPIRLYLLGEAGPVLTIDSMTIAGSQSATASSKSINLGAAFTSGLELGTVDVRAGFLAVDVGHLHASTSFLMSVGMRFASF
ncbi:MAG TPA: hypothetical protein VGY54_17265 [Polyangiaceae bacterium]|jgi:hypothetical protein|nr:hypothetical protein [Polyangiaceae bacterium]